MRSITLVQEVGNEVFFTVSLSPEMIESDTNAVVSFGLSLDQYLDRSKEEGRDYLTELSGNLAAQLSNVLEDV